MRRMLLSAVSRSLVSASWFKGYTSWDDTTTPGSGRSVVSVAGYRFHSKGAQHKGPEYERMFQRDGRWQRGGGQTDRTPEPTAEGTRHTWWMLLILEELPRLFSRPAERVACTRLSPPPRLQQHAPHPPHWPRHTMARQNPPQRATSGPGLHTGTLTLTPDLPRLNITVGGLEGCFYPVIPHYDSEGPQKRPQPHCVFIRRLDKTRSAQRWKQHFSFIHLISIDRADGKISSKKKTDTQHKKPFTFHNRTL